jgi:predicted membrane-bound mannosyltransferase/DNA-binding beta-propeller fold protein YncE
MQYTKPDITEKLPPSKPTNNTLQIQKKLSSVSIVFVLILALAIFTRFYMLEPRVMSHDETSHVYFSWLFYRGNGYAHDPVTHGPLQFHLVALSYFLFGDSDTSARIPAALFSIATVGFCWFYRRYLGNAGAIIAALMFTISPYMLYYGRYVRNEAFVALFGLIMLWAILRYLETGQSRYLAWLTTVTVLHFTAKETAFIYTAQALLFLGLLFVYKITQNNWNRQGYRSYFLLGLIATITLLSAGMAVRSLATKTDLTGALVYPELANIPALTYILIAAGLIALVAAIYFLITGYSLEKIREERSFDLAILLGTLVMPKLSPFLINFLGWKIPVNASEVNALTSADILHIALVLLPIFAISIIIGLWWQRRIWLINAAIWYAIYTVFYTSMFTNGAGFFTGLVGSLGYWLEQQAVNRGGQPFYYYALVQIPIYEYLPAFGCLIAFVYMIIRIVKPTAKYPVQDTLNINSDDTDILETRNDATSTQPPAIALFGFWSATSLIAFSIAGEKMPWLTVHIALPMILVSAWIFSKLVDGFHWSAYKDNNGWLVTGLLIVFVPALIGAGQALLGVNPPFAGRTLEQLAATSEFIISLVTAIASGIGIWYLTRNWQAGQIGRAALLLVIALLSVLTARTAFTASYVNYDKATEFLVYAHSGPGDKIALEQIEELSRRLTGGLDMPVAYDSDTTYPYWWYLRNFTNLRFYQNNPTRDLRDVPAILVGSGNFGKIEPIVGQAYYRFDYIRIWWPIEDYDNLTWERMINAIRDPQMRQAIFNIWLNRDYTLYNQLTNRSNSLQNWSPAGLMRLYIRKDIVAQIWDYGTGITTEPVIADPYEGKQIDINADMIFGSMGTSPGQFQNPRDIAIAPDGTLYVADTMNNRIQHLALDGTVLQTWGTFADIARGEAPGGTFYEPWSVAVAPDGTVYVADTWNHRIQHFTANGEFIRMWGYFGQAETPFALWGPRDIAIDALGHVFVTDTGNKRVVVFDREGNFVTQFGSIGFEPGQFDEPVGIAVDEDGLVYIADTWNQRIQVMAPDSNGSYIPFLNYEVVAWYGESLDNKPYLAVDQNGNLYVSDPEGFRILHFRRTGTFINFFGDYGTGTNRFNLPTGVAVDSLGGLWVADSANHRIMHFSLPGE